MKDIHQLRPACDLEADADGIWGCVPPIEARPSSPWTYDLHPDDASLFQAGTRARLIVSSGERREASDVTPYYRRHRPDGLVRVWFRPMPTTPAPLEVPGARGLGVVAARHNSYSGKQQSERSLDAERRGEAQKYPTQT